MKKIIFTGGSGKFGRIFQKFHVNKKNIYYPSSKIFNVTNLKKIEKFIRRVKPKFIIHSAAVSRPMKLHEKNIQNKEEQYEQFFFKILLAKTMGKNDDK